jgi:hypothetical protein
VKKNKISTAAKIKSGSTSVKRAKDKSGKIVYRTNKGGRATREQWLQYRETINKAKAAKKETSDQAAGIVLALPATHHRNLTIVTQSLIMEKGYKVVLVNKKGAIADEEKDAADLTGAKKIGSYGIENAYKLQAFFNRLWKEKEQEEEEEESETSPDITYTDIIDNQETKTLYINVNDNFKI